MDYDGFNDWCQGKKDAQNAYFRQWKDGGGPCRGSITIGASIRAGLLALGATVAVGLTGCQSQFGGQTLPSPYYLETDVQYFAPDHK